MANTLTNLIPDMYEALDTVSRELVGFIPSVTIDAQVARAAKGQTVRSFVAPEATSYDIEPSIINPDNGDYTFTNVDMTISKSKYVPLRWSGEEELGVNNGGPGAAQMRVNQIAQGMRTLVNEIEADLAALHAKTSRAYGTAGTTPFGTADNFEDASNVLKILKDNGAPLTDNSLVMNTTAGAKFLGLQSKVDSQGTDQFARQGVFLPLHGLDLRESAQVVTSTAGTGASYQTSAAAAAGATTISVDTGSGTILAGDVVTFAGDANKYVVATALDSGSFTIAAPGLIDAVADNTAVTVIGAAARNMAFSRSAIVLANRLPAMPEGGDSADDVVQVTDPRSGITFELALYRERRRVRWELGTAWGVKNVKPEHTAILLG